MGKNIIIPAAIIFALYLLTRQRSATLPQLLLEDKPGDIDTAINNKKYCSCQDV